MAGGKQYETDVAIVGAGGAGMAAGIEALDAGARAVVFEQDSQLGGAAIISGGGCLIVGSPLQAENGIHDTPDLAFKDWIEWGGPSTDVIWARYYIEHSLHDLYHWAEGLGVKWVDMKVQEGNSVQRWTRPERNGLGLMTGLIAGFRKRGGEIVPETEITGLSLEGGCVTGLQGRNTRTGESVAVRSKAVIVATGGFNSNLEMVLRYNPALRNDKVLEGSGRGSTGTGHELIRRAGGYLTHMDHIWFYVYATPDYRDPAQRRGLVFRLVPGNIWVNQQGRRFHNKSMSGGNSASPALMAQSPRHAWAIMDTPMTATMEVADPYYRDGDKVVRAKVVELLDNSPFIRKADTLAELAETDGGRRADIPRHRRALQSGLRAAARDASRNSARRSSRRRRSTRHPTMPFRSSRWRARTSAAPRPTSSAACSTSISSRSARSTPRVRSQAWPVVISTGAPASKAPCWVRRFSAGASPAAGRPMRQATAAASSASRTGVEFGMAGAQCLVDLPPGRPPQTRPLAARDHNRISARQ